MSKLLRFEYLIVRSFDNALKWLRVSAVHPSLRDPLHHIHELEGFATADVISGRIRGVQSYTSFGARSIAESDAGLIVNLAARTEHDDEVCFTQHALLLRFLCICEDDNDE